MKVLFVYSLDHIHPTGRPLRTWSGMQFGISYISALLKAQGHETRLTVLASNHPRVSRQRLAQCIEEFDPGLICFTAVFSQYRFMELIAGFVKSRWPDKYLMLGGVHATLQPEEAQGGPFDALCIGEGEYPVLEVCRHLESGQAPGGIANLWIRGKDRSIEKNRPRDFIQELDQLPFPDRAMWEPWIAERPGDEMVILGGRGCPYDCTYCSNHALRKAADGRYVRMRSPDGILREVAHLHGQYPHRRIFLELETLDCYKGWTLELCDKLAAFNASVPDPVAFGSNYRINPRTIDEELFSALERANFREINIGLESGSERIRRDVLKRDYTNDDVLTVVSMARSHGMKINVYNMIGLPGESLDDHKETVRLNRLMQPDGHFTGIFYPYPGTALYRTCIQQGLIRQALPTCAERSQPVMALPNFSKTEIQRAYTWFDYHVYKGFRPVWGLLVHALLTRVYASPLANFLFQKTVRPLAGFFRKGLNP